MWTAPNSLAYLVEMVLCIDFMDNEEIIFDITEHEVMFDTADIFMS